MKVSRSSHLLLFVSLLVSLQSGIADWESVQRPETGSTILSAGTSFEPTPDDLGNDADDFLGGMVSATWVRDDNYFVEVMITRNENRVSTALGRQDTEQLHGSINTGYLFPQRSNWRPYVSVGVGTVRYDNGADFKSDEMEVNAGFGGYYELTERMFVRGDLRLMARGDIDWGPVASLGLAFQLGDVTADPPSDTDGDGVPNASDRCSNSPPGSRVNANGCPDSDRDGVYDDSDDCSNTPRGAQVDSRGCPPAPSSPRQVKPQEPMDSQKPMDRQEPGDRQEPVDRQAPGDRRRGSAEPTGQVSGDQQEPRRRPRGSGEPQDVMSKALDDAGILVQFEYDKYDIAADYDDDLQGLADLLSEHPQLNVVIEGHTDSRGSDNYNIALSERRANAVRDHLIGLGVSVGRISIVARGEFDPIASNDTDEGRALNRRAISVFPTVE